MNAKYIVLEGIQGSGKSTQISSLASWLRSQGLAVHITREPGGSDVVARILRNLTQNPTYNLNTKTEVLLYNAARAQSLEVIRNLLSRDVWVLCDRNYLTTLAIQYYARGDIKSYDDINKICEFAVGDMQPHATMILDINPEEAIKRVSTRYRTERFDSPTLDFMTKMREGYLKEAKKRKLQVVDAGKPEKDVLDELKTSIKSMMA